jgi:phosphoserine phosphatase
MSLLVTVTGLDHPGVTAGLFDALEGIEVSDVEQVVVHGRLLLGVVLEGDDAQVRTRLTAAGAALQVAVEFTQLDDAEPIAAGRHHHVVVLGLPLPPAAMAAVARRLADCGANIERIQRLASYPAQAYELLVAGGVTRDLQVALAEEAVRQRVDVAVERASLYRRARRLVVMDVDSTLVQGEVIEMLAAEAGCEAEVAKITAAAMAGEIDFEESLRARVSLLAGLPVEAVDRVRAAVRLTPGARTLVRTLKRLGYAVAVVSGGFTAVTDDLVATLRLDHSLANVLEIADGHLTGRVSGPVVDRAAKAAALRRFAVSEGLTLAQTVAIGDGANDLDMLAAAGLGIAFNAKPVVRDAADTALSVPFLDAVLFLLGITREEVEVADARRGTGGQTEPDEPTNLFAGSARESPDNSQGRAQ